MFLASLIVSLIVSVILTAVFVWGFRRKGPWASILAFFIVVFLSSWAGGMWISPFGPTVQNIQWLPFAMVGLITALFLAAAVPNWSTRVRTEVGAQPERRRPPVALLSAYYWVAIILLIVTIIVR